MNREICFRLWDKHLKQMIFEGYHVIGEVTMFGMINQHVYENPGTANSPLERCGDFVEMQFTGRQDRCGKNVYEDDICTAHKPNSSLGEQGDIYQVIYCGDHNQFVFKCISSDNDFRIGRIAMKANGQPYLLSNIDKVIGNIHANPELINKKQ